jgi:hypothetical protein
LKIVQGLAHVKGNGGGEIWGVRTINTPQDVVLVLLLPQGMVPRTASPLISQLGRKVTEIA